MTTKKLATYSDYKEQFKSPEKALDVALDIRKFEIELYWKRAAYFWFFIGASLTGYVTAITHNAPFWVENLFSCLGLIFSLSWFLVNKGSKYWQENWEMHVDLLEDVVMGPLYKHICHNPYDSSGIIGSRRYSVTKINLIVSLFVLIVWAILFITSWISIIYRACSLGSIQLTLQTALSLDVIAVIAITFLTLLFFPLLLFNGKSKDEPKGDPGVYPRPQNNIFPNTKSE